MRQQTMASLRSRPTDSMVISEAWSASVFQEPASTSMTYSWSSWHRSLACFE